MHGRLLNQAHLPLLHHHGKIIGVRDFNISYSFGRSGHGLKSIKQGLKTMKPQIQSIFDICHGPLQWPTPIFSKIGEKIGHFNYQLPSYVSWLNNVSIINPIFLSYPNNISLGGKKICGKLACQSLEGKIGIYIFNKII